jgi:hypothetical protein
MALRATKGDENPRFTRLCGELGEKNRRQDRRRYKDGVFDRAPQQDQG